MGTTTPAISSAKNDGSHDDMWLSNLLARNDPFSATNIRDSRLVWDPSTHRYFSEECSFFFIRFRRTHGAAEGGPLERVDGWLNEQQILSKYVYLLYGYYDVLVRVWALPARMVNFRQSVKERLGTQVLAAQEFSVAHCKLILKPHEIDNNNHDLSVVIESMLNQINTLKTMEGNLVATEHQKACRDLIDKGIVHPVRGYLESPNAPCFRFVVLIQLDMHGQGVRSQQLQEFVTRYNNMVGSSGMIRCAVYEGSGFGDFLVSGLITQHESLSTFSGALATRLLELGVECRTETHITADSVSIERDVVDPMQKDAIPAETRMIRFLVSQQIPTARLTLKLHEMKSEDRKALIEVFEKHEFKFLSSEFSIYFKDFLLSKALADQRYLQRSLMCLMEMEGIMSELWLKGCINAKAQKKVLEVGRSVGFKEKIDLNKLNLRQMTDITSKLVADGQYDDWLAKQLGLNWIDILLNLNEVRNAVAHGRLYVERDYLSKHWQEVANQLDELGTLYDRLRSKAVS